MEEETTKGLLEKSYHCLHSPEERLLRGTWCTPELFKAVEVGYRIVHIHEVWHFPEEQRQEGLFADYVNTWLKIKQESAGYPGWAQTEEQKQQYVRDYQAKEGITLDPLLIEKNPGRKATAKLMLNSFWGKFGENIHKKTIEAVTTPAHLFALVSDTLTDIHTVRICSQDFLEVVYWNLKENQPDNGRQHFHCCLHYLLGPFKVVLLSRAATTTGLILRH